MSEVKKSISSEIWIQAAENWGEPIEELQEVEERIVKGFLGGEIIQLVLKKVKAIIAKEDSTTIGIFAYNKVMADYLKQMSENISMKIRVYSFEDWAEKLFTTAGVVYKKKQLKLPDYPLLKAVDKVNLELNQPVFTNKRSLIQLINEIMFIDEKGYTREAEYMRSDRQDLSLTQETRKIFFKIYKEYLSMLETYQPINEKEFERKFYQGISLSIPAQEYDHVLIVHAEDYTFSELSIMMNIARKSFIVYADKNREIFRTDFSWSNFDLEPKSSPKLKSTKQIVSLASSLLCHDPLYQNKKRNFTKPVLPAKQGWIPKVKIASNPNEFVVKKIKKTVEKNPSLTIGVLGRNWNELVELEKDFQEHNIFCTYLYEKATNISEQEVNVTTFHNAKGLKFDVVFILASEENDRYYELLGELSEFSLSPEVLNRRLLYTGMISAVKRLYIVATSPNVKYIKELDNTLYKTIE